MRNIKDYRPDGLEVTLDDESVVKVMLIRNNPRFGILARVKGQGRVILWNGVDVDTHLNDTEEQLITQLKAVL